MSHDPTRGTAAQPKRWPILVTVLALITLAALLSRPTAEARVEPGVHEILLPDLKYTGNASCSGSECHSADQAKQIRGQKIGNESNLWSEWDPHATAYDTLRSDDSAKIASELGIDDAMSSSRCLTCHAMDVPQQQRGDLFALNNAVGCESCHGPAEKWLEPHAKEGWTPEKRKELGAKGLMDEYGLVDTTHLSVRAHTCVACHLQIDKDMIDAGHPPLEFELYAYNYYATNDDYYRHWEENFGKTGDAKLWAAGQFAANQAIQSQLESWKKEGWDTTRPESLANIYSTGVKIAKEHLGVDSAKAVDQAGDFSGDQLAAALAEWAKLAEQAGSDRERRIVGYGAGAIGSAAYYARGQNVPDAFWTHYKTATAGQAGDAYVEAVQKMAGMVQQ